MASRTISSPINLAAVALAILASAVALLLTEPASAHANLIEASPKPSEELDAPPERVIIWFTEPIEPAFSSIKVLSASGEDVTAGATQFDATEPTAMWVPLATLENGTFTVVWRNVSSVDGHKVTGSFLFAIGEPLGAANQLAVEEQPLLQSPVDPIIRWLIYIGVAVFAGGLFLEIAIATRVARSDEQLAVLEFAQSASTRFAVVALWAIVVVLVAQIAQLALQTAIAFDNASAAVDPARVIDVVSQSDWGRFWSWRFTAAVLAAVTIILARHSRQVFRRSSNDDELDELPLVTETPWGIAAIAFGGVYVLLIALTSHNAATPGDIRLFAIATDLIHIVAATIWVGGIAYLVVASLHAIRSGDASSRTAILQFASGFSPLAILVTTVLVASGVVSSLMQVTVLEALNSPYGIVLCAKIIIIIVLIAIATKNNRSVAKSKRTGSFDTRNLTRYISVELGIAFTVLLATAGLASLEPARQYAERGGIGVEDYVGLTQTIDGAEIDVTLDPGSTGANSLTVNIQDPDGGPFERADEVRSRIKFLDDDFGEYFIALDNPAPGEWRLEDVTIGVAGAYQIDVTVVRSDSFDSHVSIRFSAASKSFASDLIRPSVQTAMTAFGVLIAVASLAFIGATTLVRKPVRFDFGLRHGIATVVASIGMLVILNASTVGFGLPTEDKGNPSPLTQESVAMGRATYDTSCATCHGDQGRGDGPAGVALNPPPAYLAIHVPLHTDSELYGFIANGIEGTPMVAQLGNLTSDEIWHLVNYIRTISE